MLQIPYSLVCARGRGEGGGFKKNRLVLVFTVELIFRSCTRVEKLKQAMLQYTILRTLVLVYSNITCAVI
jgi:hypothetical protein